jgi:hypothetical protein
LLVAEGGRSVGPVVMAFRDKVVEMGYARSTTETSG